ncbi:MAG: hypothetical protein REI11_09980 [Patulibacter sp.]|nr:hypothetical protein [Patulibacter sp.]
MSTKTVSEEAARDRLRHLSAAVEQWRGGVEWMLDPEDLEPPPGPLPRWAGISTDGRGLGVTVSDDRAAIVASMTDDVTDIDAGRWVPMELVDLDNGDGRDISAAVTVADPWAPPRSGVEVECQDTGLRVAIGRRDEEHGREPFVQIDTDNQPGPLGILGPKLAVFINDSDLYDGTDYGLSHPSSEDVVTVPAQLAGFLAEVLREHPADQVTGAALDALVDAIGGRERAEDLAARYDRDA